MTDRDFIAVTLAALGDCSKRGGNIDKIATARMACEDARLALAMVPHRAVTLEHMRRCDNAIKACRRARLRIGRALADATDEDERLVATATRHLWQAVELDVLIRKNERRLAEIEGTPFPFLAVV